MTSTMEVNDTVVTADIRGPPSKSNKNSKKKSTSLPTETVEYLKAWMMSPEHIAHPYPTEVEKAQIMKDTGIEMKQLTNWFVNNRKRFWKPRVEARLRETQDTTVPSSPPIIKKNGSVLSLKDLLNDTNSNKSPSSTPTRKTSRRRASRSVSVAETTTVDTTTSCASPTSRIISEYNSVVSASDGAASSDDEEASSSYDEPKTESIHVHILRPESGGQPHLSDVSVSHTIDGNQVLKTFEDCALTYRLDDDRDAEITRIKKHYLLVYLSEREQLEPRATSVIPPDRKRRRNTQDSPRTKYHRVCVETWKEACQSAAHIYDHDLPSLEEASRLFGFAP